jgi:hypothetical protein
MRLLTTNLCSLSSTTVTASSEDPNFPASNLKSPHRSKRWRSTNVSSEWVVFDFQTAEPVDSVAVLWPKEVGILLSGAAGVFIQANATNVWSSPALSYPMTIDNDYVMASRHFETPESYRYWRVVVSDDTNPNGFLELGVVWIGAALDLEEMQNGFTFEVADQSVVTRTAFGHEYVDEYPEKLAIEFSYMYMSYSAIQTLENAFRTNGVKKPVMVFVDAGEAVFSANHFAIYGKFAPEFATTHVNYNLLNAEGIRIEEIA